MRETSEIIDNSLEGNDFQERYIIDLRKRIRKGIRELAENGIRITEFEAVLLLFRYDQITATEAAGVLNITKDQFFARIGMS